MVQKGKLNQQQQKKQVMLIKHKIIKKVASGYIGRKK